MPSQNAPKCPSILINRFLFQTFTTMSFSEKISFSEKGTFAEMITNIQIRCRKYSGTPNQLGMPEYCMEAAQTTDTILQLLEECCEHVSKEAHAWDPFVDGKEQEQEYVERELTPIHVDIRSELDKILKHYENIPDNQQGMAAHLGEVRSDLKRLIQSVVPMRDSFLALHSSWSL